MSAPKKSIMRKLEEIPGRVIDNPDFGKLLSDMAVAAIIVGALKPDGTPTTEWLNYMKEIVGPTSTNQLKRLTFQDASSGQDYIRKSNAYIVSNAVCGTATGTHTADRVDDRIDENVPPE
jgi:hypothetical protein